MHHAYVYIGDTEAALASLPAEVKQQGSDVRHMRYDTFGVEDSRELTHESSRRPVERDVRSFVIVFRSATHEAQNALLKTLEEPPETSRFYIIIPREDTLIATVHSRLMRMPVAEGADATPHSLVDAFIALPYVKRLDLVAEKAKAKDEAWMSSLLGELEHWCATQTHFEVMRDVLLVRRYFERRGASRKMLLEHLALTLPHA